MDLTQICEAINEPKVIIKTFKEADTFVNLQHALETLKPTFIIMYHTSMTAVREIEVRITIFSKKKNYTSFIVSLNPVKSFEKKR